MPIVSVKEKRIGRESTANARWQRTYTRTWIVVTDNPSIGAAAIRASIGVGPGNIYKTSTETDAGSFIQDVRAVCTEADGKQWEVTANYGPYDPNQNPQDPTQAIPKVNWDPAQFQRLAEKDRNGKDITTSAGVPFNPAVQKDDTRPVLQIVRNEQTYDESLAGQYRDKVNDKDFWGYGPNQVKCAHISGSREWNQDIGYYWVVTYQFHMNKDGWTSHLLDAGTMQLDTPGTSLIPCKTKQGLPVPEAVPLDGNGRQLAVGGTPVYLDYDIYEEADFSALNFDSLYQDISSYKYTPPTV